MSGAHLDLLLRPLRISSCKSCYAKKKEKWNGMKLKKQQPQPHANYVKISLTSVTSRTFFRACQPADRLDRARASPRTRSRSGSASLEANASNSCTSDRRCSPTYEYNIRYRQNNKHYQYFTKYNEQRKNKNKKKYTANNKFLKLQISTSNTQLKKI